MLLRLCHFPCTHDATCAVQHTSLMVGVDVQDDALLEAVSGLRELQLDTTSASAHTLVDHDEEWEAL